MKLIQPKNMWAVLMAILFASSAFANTVGKEAPDFTLKTNDDKSLTLSKLKGKRGALFVFFATWCPACMAEVPAVKKFVEKSKEKGVLVYGVNYKQSKQIVKKFMDSKKVNYRVLLDSEGDVAKAYNVTGIPLIIGVDKAGVVQLRDHAIPKDTDALIEKLTK